MVTLDTTTKVLIIGSGLSAVALAQILRKANVKFEIFERDHGTRRQGWTIGLDECLEPLQQLLPDDLDDLATSSPNYKLKQGDTFTIVDGPTHAVLGTTSSKATNSVAANVFANREKFRKVLVKNLNIQYGKRLVSFQEDREGVTAFFEDGTSARGDILVGADGSNSSVRAQLLPGFKATPSPFIVFLGTVILSKTQYEPLLKHSTNGPLIGGPNLKAYLLLMDYLDDETAIFNWNVSWRTENFEDDYIKWRSASPEAQLEEIQHLIKNWPPEIVQGIEQSKGSDVQTPPLTIIETVLPSKGLPRGRVTLIGDAAHSMVPFRGMGANTALLDSCDLGKALIDGIKAKAELEWALKCYEDIMVPRGRENVLESRATAEAAASEGLAGGRPISSKNL